MRRPEGWPALRGPIPMPGRDRRGRGRASRASEVTTSLRAGLCFLPPSPPSPLSTQAASTRGSEEETSQPVFLLSRPGFEFQDASRQRRRTLENPAGFSKTTSKKVRGP